MGYRNKRKPGKQDQNFDELAHKFQKKVYGGLKGDIRLAVLKNDLNEFCPQLFDAKDKKTFDILDAGGGYGPFSLGLAGFGHRICLCDISEKMLETAQKECDAGKLSDQVKIIHSSIQGLGDEHKGKYDIVLCHAVLEWLSEPEKILELMPGFLKKEGLLSITFYNLNGTIFKNLLRTNYRKVLSETYAGWPGSLTPPNPMEPDQVVSLLEASGFKILCRSGMRVFHDYILDLKDRDKNPETVIRLELKFSRQLPFRDMGRYQHIICRPE